jgi:prevent-host-death family protein
MQTKTVDIREAAEHLSELLSLVAEGMEIIVTQNDTPLARVVPFEQPPRIPGLHRGAITVSDDFDDPLPDEFWIGEK